VSLGLYMDVQVPAAITRALRRRGVEVLTAQEDGAARWLDPALLDRAAVLGRIVFTRDSDYSRRSGAPAARASRLRRSFMRTSSTSRSGAV